MRISHHYIAIAFTLVLCSSVGKAQTELKLPQLFSDHMVLQQKDNVNLWGVAGPLQKVTISGSWGKEVSIKADRSGKWKVLFPTPKAGGPYTVTISAQRRRIVLRDVLIGEVWLAAGQSNMDINLAGWPPNDTISNSKQEIAEASYPGIRLLKVPFNMSVKPLDSAGGKWVVATPQTAGDFSATAYFYARKLYSELHVPIGIIQSSIGGTPAESWTSKTFLNKMSDFNQSIDELEKLQCEKESWTRKWLVQPLPKNDEEWRNIDFSDLEASKETFDDSGWDLIKLPARFDRLASGVFDGAMWFRKQFTVEDLNADYVLKISAIDDMDATYINGEKVGGLAGAGAANAPRGIAIPKGLLKNGINTIAIRAIDTGGPGAISGQIMLTSNNGKSIPLEGEWKSHLVAEILNGRFYVYGLETHISGRPDLTRINSNSPTVLYNAMINPLVSYKIKGAIWYQGETNVGRAEQYKRIFPNMIEDWRNKWGYEFPFYYVQLAPYLYGDANQKEQSQKLRDAQRYALNLPKTGMAVTLDVGSLQTVHPPDKKTVGERLARFALANEYGRKIIASGPLYKKTIVAGNKLIVEFSSIGSGLRAGGKGLTNFEIAGADRAFFPAQAKLEDNRVVLSSSSVANPRYVRYAWSDGSLATLFNREGLPAATFTSED